MIGLTQRVLRAQSRGYVNPPSSCHRADLEPSSVAVPRSTSTRSIMHRTEKSAIHELRRLARQRGGECLSNRYANAISPLQWRCGLGHKWQATLASVVRRNTWCPVCAGNRKLNLRDLQRIARERGGKCLSRKYVNGRTPLTWECKYGHRWKAAAEQVKGSSHKKGTWCPKCYDQRRIFRPLGTIQEMRRLAIMRCGRCMSPCYTGSRTKLLWGCRSGHQWYAVPGNIKRGNWCPTCARNQRLKLSDYRALAAAHGGRCLSTQYRNNDTNLKLRCAKGHEWFATGTSIRRGSWCARCAHDRRRGARRRRPGHLHTLSEIQATGISI